jgi:hypothetical protein
MSSESGYLGVSAGSRVALLVNGLGATTGLELYAAAGAALGQLRSLGVCSETSARVNVVAFGARGFAVAGRLRAGVGLGAYGRRPPGHLSGCGRWRPCAPSLQ